jgi:hypothetical protein
MKILCLFAVFLNGGGAALNWFALSFPENMPANVEGNWWEMALHLCIAVMFGYSVIKEARQ